MEKIKKRNGRRRRGKYFNSKRDCCASIYFLNKKRSRGVEIRPGKYPRSFLCHPSESLPSLSIDFFPVSLRSRYFSSPPRTPFYGEMSSHLPVAAPSSSFKKKKKKDDPSPKSQLLSPSPEESIGPAKGTF